MAPLRKLEDGWLDGDGRAPSPTDLDRLGAALTARFLRLLPEIYPTPAGGIQLEWILEKRYFTVEVLPGMKSGHVHVLELDTKKDSLTGFDCSQEAWARLAKAVEEHR